MQKKIYFFHIFIVLLKKFQSFKIVKKIFDDKNKIFSKKIFSLKFYFATIISFG